MYWQIYEYDYDERSSVKIRVYYEDTDAGGIVYHTNYIKYCERARSERFFSQGIRPLEGNRSGFVVRNISASFLSPAALGDMLEVKSYPLNIKRSMTTLKQEIYKGEKKIFEMEIVLVYIDDGRPSRIPEHFRNLIEPEAKVLP